MNSCSELVNRVIESIDINVLHGRSRLLSALSHPDDLPANEIYEWGSEFNYYINNQKTISSNFVLIGTYESNDSIWTWGFNNNVHLNDKKLSENLGSSILIEDIKILMGIEQILLHENQAWYLSDYIAQELGFVACYPAKKEGKIYYLAVNLDWCDPNGNPIKNDSSCSLCGIPKHIMGKLIEGKFGSICEDCVNQIQDYRSTLKDQNNFPKNIRELETEKEKEKVSCFMTGEYLPRIFTRYTSISWLAVERANEVLNEIE